MTSTGPDVTAPVGQSVAPQQVPRLARVTNLLTNPSLKRFVICLAGVLVLAVMTGPAGSNTAPTSGFTGSLGFPRLFWFLGFAVVLFAIVSAWRASRTSASATANRIRASVLELRVRTRVALDGAVVAFGFVWVSWISPGDTWKGGVCIQIGCALAAMEMVVYLFKRWSLHVARPAGYAVFALYGVLSWSRNSVSAYLSSIGAVPHDRTLGRALVWIAIALCALEGVLVGLAAARKAIVPRRGRGLAAAGGLVVLAYGWLMWTTWSLWRASTRHSFAHWLASIYLLPHNRPAGLSVMVVGGLVLVGVVCWLVLDLVGGIGGARPEHGRYQFTGITTQGRFTYGKTGITIAALLVAIEWPLHLNAGVQSILTTQVAIYVLLAMGLNVVVGFAGLLDLGYVAFWAIGAYTTAYFTGALPIHPPFLLNPFWVIPFSIVTAMFAGVVLGTPTLRLRGDYLAIVTLGFGEIIEIAANNLNGVTGGPAGTPGFIPQFSVHILGISYRWTGTVLPYYYLILGVVVVFTIAFSFLEHSRVGRSWTAIREDEVAADSLGINALKYKVMAFSIGASTAGFAGVFFASQVQSLVPNDFSVQTSILILVFVIFGGMGSIAGAVIGAAVIQWLPQYLNYLSGAGGSVSWWQWVFQWAAQRYQQQDEYIYLGALLIVLMIFRPEGIIPSRRRRREILLTEQGVGHLDSPGGPVRLKVLGERLPASYGKLSLDEPGYIGPETE
jgi:branched-chain amino acid transport system permease protein